MDVKRRRRRRRRRRRLAFDGVFVFGISSPKSFKNKKKGRKDTPSLNPKPQTFASKTEKRKEEKRRIWKCHKKKKKRKKKKV